MDRSIIDLSEHCSALSHLLATFDNRCIVPTGVIQTDESWGDAANWLHIASSILHVDVDTQKFDVGAGYCETADAYHEELSKHVAYFVTSLSRFNFIWNAFELVARILNPPHVPKRSLRNGGSSFVFNVMYLIRNDYSEIPAPSGYDDVLQGMMLIERLVFPNSTHAILLFGDEKTIGIDIVRRLRNRFAHGNANVNMVSEEFIGEDFVGYKKLDEFLNLCSRMVLLTIQMAVIARFETQKDEIEHWNGREFVTEKIGNLAYSVHLTYPTKVVRQPSLFHMK